MRTTREEIVDGAIILISLSVAVLLVVFWPILWLYCRLEAKRCPYCQSRWSTELCGEWDGEEEWKCHHCGLMFCEKY
jgi:hypothetical protein